MSLIPDSLTVISAPFLFLSCSFPQHTAEIAIFGQNLKIRENQAEIPCIFSLFSGKQRSGTRRRH